MALYSDLRLQRVEFRNSISYLGAVADFNLTVAEGCVCRWLWAATALPGLYLGLRHPKAK